MERVRAGPGAGGVLLAALGHADSGWRAGPQVRHEDGIRRGQRHRLLDVLPDAARFVFGYTNTDLFAGRSGCDLCRFWRIVG